MKKTLLAIAVAAGTMFAAQAPQSTAPGSTETQQTAPEKTTKTKKHAKAKKHHAKKKGSTEGTATSAPQK
jgi:Ni/Co efflux regulator RcnB